MRETTLRKNFNSTVKKANIYRIYILYFTRDVNQLTQGITTEKQG